MLSIAGSSASLTISAVRPRIAQHVPVVGRLPERVQRDRHGADLDRAEEAVDELGAVEQQQQHPLLGPHAEAAQRVAEAVDAPQQLVVGDPLVAALDRDVGAAPIATWRSTK